uniref:Uncharacterized protein n=1 Tax=viral metagenome TaxID=1070528 RepID=A0A6H2A1Z3_9ZZZZ
MITGDKSQLDQIVQTHHCPDHPDKALTVAWLTTGEYAVRCGGDHYPEEVTRIPTLTEAYKQGEPIPEPLAGNIKKGLAKRLPRQPKYAGALTLGGVEARDLATGEVLGKDLVDALVEYAYQYGLDPMRGHVCLMYGKPYITIDGYLYHANRQNKPYTLTSRPLNETERGMYQVKEGDHAWRADIIYNEGKSLTGGTGIITQAEMTAKSKKDTTRLASPVVAAHPWQLAQKRAEWQALRRAFPIGGEE